MNEGNYVPTRRATWMLYNALCNIKQERPLHQLQYRNKNKKMSKIMV